jgi:hypothetical protein
MTDQKRDFANGRCCVFQPFDKGDFDKRYDDVLVPAIEAAPSETRPVSGGLPGGTAGWAERMKLWPIIRADNEVSSTRVDGAG